MERHEYETMAHVEQDLWWYVGMRRIADVWLRSIPIARILDAGCGTGGNLPWLAQYGNVAGFDFAEVACDYAATVHTSVACAGIEAIPIRDHAVDLVTCFDVIYHQAVHDDYAALQECYRVLRPGGYMLLRLPALAWLRGTHHQHVHGARRYTRQQVHTLVTNVGFTIHKLCYVNTLLLPAAWAQVASERFRSDPYPTQSHLRRLPAWQNAIGLQALTIEAALLSIGVSLPIGVSLLCLAQRPAAEGVE